MSNFSRLLNQFKQQFPDELKSKVDVIGEFVVDYIKDHNFTVKFLNSCSAGFSGVRTRDQIIICSPSFMATLGDFLYTIFHEIRHEEQIRDLKMDNPLTDYDLEDFEKLSEQYWEMEMDAHEYAIEWVDKIGNIINLPKEYYKLSPMVTSYPSMGHMVRDQIVNINKIIKELKQKGYDYSDISDLPFVKKHLDKLEDLF